MLTLQYRPEDYSFLVHLSDVLNNAHPTPSPVPLIAPAPLVNNMLCGSLCQIYGPADLQEMWGDGKEGETSATGMNWEDGRVVEGRRREGKIENVKDGIRRRWEGWLKEGERGECET